MLNRIILIGRLTRDPETRFTSTTGKAVCNFTLAVDRRFKNAKGEKEADFFRVTCWDKLAERCKEYLVKGQLVAVDGRVEIRNWTNNQGEQRTTVEVHADDVRFLSRAQSSGSRSSSEGPDSDVYENDAPPPPRQDSAPYRKNTAPAAPPAGGKSLDQEIEDEINLDDEDPF